MNINVADRFLLRFQLPHHHCPSYRQIKFNNFSKFLLSPDTLRSHLHFFGARLSTCKGRGHILKLIYGQFLLRCIEKLLISTVLIHSRPSKLDSTE